MKYGDIRGPKSIGFDERGFRVIHRKKRYSCYCPICNSNIVDWGPIESHTDYVICGGGHQIDCDEVIIVYAEKVQ